MSNRPNPTDGLTRLDALDGGRAKQGQTALAAAPVQGLTITFENRLHWTEVVGPIEKSHGAPGNRVSLQPDEARNRIGQTVMTWVTVRSIEIAGWAWPSRGRSR